jgi:zeaxanthin glucosyltransferase
LIQKILHTPAYREKAQYFRNVIAKRPGLEVAAQAIEHAFEQAIEKRPLELSRA